MRIDIITVLPAMIEGFCNESILARAQKKGLAEIHLHNLRDYSTDKWKRVDNYPYGGFAACHKQELFVAQVLKNKFINSVAELRFRR